eukprot:gene2777-554_t
MTLIYHPFPPTGPSVYPTPPALDQFDASYVPSLHEPLEKSDPNGQKHPQSSGLYTELENNHSVHPPGFSDGIGGFPGVRASNNKWQHTASNALNTGPAGGPDRPTGPPGTSLLGGQEDAFGAGWGGCGGDPGQCCSQESDPTTPVPVWVESVVETGPLTSRTASVERKAHSGTVPPSACAGTDPARTTTPTMASTTTYTRAPVVSTGPALALGSREEPPPLGSIDVNSSVSIGKKKNSVEENRKAMLEVNPFECPKVNGRVLGVPPTEKFDPVDLQPKSLTDKLPKGNELSKLAQEFRPDPTRLVDMLETGNTSLAIQHLRETGNIEPDELEDVESRRGNTPLLTAAACGDSNLFKFLLQRGADVEKFNTDGKGVIHLSIESNSSEILAAVQELALSEEDGTATTPLQVAVLNEQEKIVEILISNQAKVGAVGREGLLPPLCFAAAVGNFKIARTLLFNGAEVNFSGVDGMTSLHHAASRGHFDASQ